MKAYTSYELEEFDTPENYNMIPYQLRAIRADVDILEKKIVALEKKLDTTNRLLEDLITKLKDSNRWKVLEV